MPVISKHLPGEVIDEIARHSGLIFRAGRAAPSGAFPWANYPTHEIYFSELSHCADGTGLQNARHVGWRMLVEHESGAAVSVEVGVGEGGVPRFDCVNEGPYAAATQTALRAAPMSLLTERELVVRMVKAPAIYVAALWFHDEAEFGGGYVTPLEPAPEGLTAGAIMSVADFENAVRPIAQRRLAFGADPALGG